MEEPTPKQIDFLKKQNCPIPKTREQASELVKLYVLKFEREKYISNYKQREEQAKEFFHKRDLILFGDDVFEKE